MRNEIRSSIPQYNPIKSTSQIPSGVAEIPQSVNPEEEKFIISFRYYCDDLCEINYLEKNCARSALRDLRLIGKCNNLHSLKDNNIGIYGIVNNGEYRKLFRKLSPDIEIREHRLQNTARLFYFIARNLFYIRAIKNSHFETDKQR